MTTFTIGDFELTTKSDTSASVLTATGEAFLSRVAKREMPPYTPLNVTVFRALIEHGGVLSDDVIQLILPFFEQERDIKVKYKATLDVLWSLLGWRTGDIEVGDANLGALHQFMGIVVAQPSLSRDATYLERALHTLYNHVLFEQLYDAEAFSVAREHVQYRLLSSKKS